MKNKELIQQCSSEVFIKADELRNIRSENYNNGSITLDDYAIFGMRSWGHDVHKEATRICSWIEQNKYEKVMEHCIDLCNYASFLYEYTKKELNK